MALIKCPDCGKEVSSNAPNCVHCGCPIAVKGVSTTANAGNVFKIKIVPSGYSVYNSKGQYIGETPMEISNPDSSYEVCRRADTWGFLQKGYTICATFTVRLDKPCKYIVNHNNTISGKNQSLSVTSEPL